MYLYLDDLQKSDASQGDQLGGQYLRRIVTGTTKDGRPQYRYLRSKEEVAAYETEQKQSGKDKGKDKKKEAPSLKDKLKDEQKETKQKQAEGRNPSLFLKDKKTTKKSLSIYLED